MGRIWAEFETNSDAGLGGFKMHSHANVNAYLYDEFGTKLETNLERNSRRISENLEPNSRRNQKQIPNEFVCEIGNELETNLGRIQNSYY